MTAALSQLHWQVLDDSAPCLFGPCVWKGVRWVEATSAHAELAFKRRPLTSSLDSFIQQDGASDTILALLLANWSILQSHLFVAYTLLKRCTSVSQLGRSETRRCCSETPLTYKTTFARFPSDSTLKRVESTPASYNGPRYYALYLHAVSLSSTDWLLFLLYGFFLFMLRSFIHSLYMLRINRYEQLSSLELGLVHQQYLCIVVRCKTLS